MVIRMPSVNIMTSSIYIVAGVLSYIYVVLKLQISIGEIEPAVQVELEYVINECTLDINQCIPTPSENKQKIELDKIDQKIEKLIASLTEVSEITMA